MKVSNEYIQHELNESIRNCLEKMKVKINDELEYDISLEQDYGRLLKSFENHIKMIVKINRGLK